jgi:galactose mutarotase-like enzyme
MAFEDGDASGIDECIPTVSGCEIQTEDGPIAVPDHGDFWRIPFACRREQSALLLEAEGFTLPLHFQKRLELVRNRLITRYSLRNTGPKAVQFVWSAHPGFAVDEEDRIVFPESVQQISVWYSAQSRLGEPGQTHSWPLATDAGNRSIDLSRVGGPGAEVGDKLFISAPLEGWVALLRKRIQRRVEVRFNPADAPHVGVWLSYGGWPPNSPKRQHCVALEPCTSPADSLATAIDRKSARTLEPGANWEWEIEIRVIPA